MNKQNNCYRRLIILLMVQFWSYNSNRFIVIANVEKIANVFVPARFNTVVFLEQDS